MNYLVSRTCDTSQDIARVLLFFLAALAALTIWQMVLQVGVWIAHY
jgi:hypothetical protein